MGHLFPSADEQFARSFGARLIGKMMAAQQRKADREILRTLRQQPYRELAGIELERRISGQ
jgi:hypothetical protein